jgi:hypothetical protein
MGTCVEAFYEHVCITVCEDSSPYMYVYARVMGIISISDLICSLVGNGVGKTIPSTTRAGILSCGCLLTRLMGPLPVA